MQNRIQRSIIAGVVAIAAIVLSLMVTNSESQAVAVVPLDGDYEFGKDVIDICAGRTYVGSTQPISCDFSNRPTMHVSNWDQVAANDKTTISNTLAAKGWTAFTP